MTRYVATVTDNTTGEILGESPGGPDPRAQWRWLHDLRREVEDEFPEWNVGEYTDTVEYLDYAATECEFGNPREDWPLAADGTGRIVGATPGLGDHDGDSTVSDPGITYAVVVRQS